MEQVNNNSSPNFNISTNQLYYSHETDSLKMVIKNTSLKTTYYQVILQDQEHFKIMYINRAFSLAPGMSKQVIIKHICGQFCKIQARQILQAKVRDYNGNSIGFQCRCSSFVIKKKQVYLDYPKTIELGQFDQKINFDFQIKNISNKNFKIVFNDQLQTKSQNESTVLIQNTDKKLLIKNLTRDCILLTKTTLKFQFQLNMSKHGQLKQNIQFTIIAQEPSNKYIQRKAQQKQQNQNKFDVYCINLTGFSVSKKLIIKDQSQQIISQIRNQLLVGTSRSSYFYIQTQYHQDIPYTLQAYFQTLTPDQYADKWKYLSIQLNDSNQKIIKDQHKLGNMCQGVLKRQSLNKIQYKITARYTVNDQNYVIKYSKIQFEDDSNALRMRNSQYARKYESMQIKIVAKIQTSNIPPYKNITLKNLRPVQNNFQISIPLKFTLVNPSLRVKVTQLQQQSTCVCVTILNQTKINIPYSFPIHSLYRISNSSQKYQAQSLQQIFIANKKQFITIKWTKNNQRCPVYMEIPSFDLVLYEIKNTQSKGKNVVVMPASRRRPMTSISSNINAKSRQNETILLKNSQNILNYGLLAQKSQTPLKISIRATSSIKRYITPETTISLKYTNLTKPQQKIFQKSLSKKVTITKQKRNILQNKRDHQIIPTIDQLSYLVQSNKMIKNTHYSRNFLLQIFDIGYLLLEPGQFYIFDSSIKFKCSKNTNQWGFNSMPSIKYRIYGHTPVYSIQFSDSQIQQPIIPIKHQPTTPTKKTVLKRQILPSRIRQTSNMFQLPTYQIISRQIKMSFKQSKQQFQIIQPILIKNCLSTQQLQINCVSIDGQFFKCKQPNGILIIKPNQIGQFKIGFFPQNTIKLSILNHQAPQSIRRRAIVKSQSPISTPQSNQKIQKQIKLLINKTIQQITCIGQIVQKNCSIKPYKINLTNCKYGSPQIIESMIITNTSPYKINYIIQYPSQITIKPKSGVILPKATQNCTITFKPCKKISNLQTNVKVYIGGSHLQLVPLHINVQDPQIYIKQTQLIPIQNAICGAQIQQLNLQMNIINNNPSQSFIQINLKDTPLYLGYTKNYHSINSKIVLQNFHRCSQIIQQNIANKRQRNHPTIKKYSYSVTSITNQQNLLHIDNNILNISDNCIMPQMCTITVDANSFLIIPLTLRIKNVKIGENKLTLCKNIANLLGYGQIKSPHIIKYNCNKTLLEINPYKQLHQIILTQGQTNYQIHLRNMAEKYIKVKTKITNIQQKQRIITNQNITNQQNLQCQQSLSNNINLPHVVCTYKDIHQYLKPQCTIDLNINFICFQVNKKPSKTSYQLTIYLKQYNTNNDDSSLQINRQSIRSSNNQQQKDGYIQYFTTIINVIVPQPFLSITPNILVLPTVGVNIWSNQSFYIVNNGFKEIYIKIKKPVNITFDFQCQIIPHQLPTVLHTDRSNASKEKLKQKQSIQKQNKLPRQNSLSSISNTSALAEQNHPNRQKPRILQNQLTKINNRIQIRVSFKSKTTISFKCILQIQDNFNKKYQLAIAGTCTDSPFFINQDNPIHKIRQFVSSLSFNSYNSQEEFISSKHMKKNNQHNKNVIRRNNLQPTDIQDLLFLNNWIGSLLPQLSNQSTFFYIWLSQTNNFFKFITEFNISLTSSAQKKIKNQQKQKQKYKQKQKLKDRFKYKFIKKDNEFSQNIQYHKMSLSSILQIMKQKGFQFNSIRVDLLQKADQMQWLTFMWFFFSKAIISPNFLSWFGKSIGYRQIKQITYNYIQNNYQQLLTILLTTKFQLKKQNNDNKAIDWKYLIQNFQQLLQNFKHIESRRHLILSMNILYHKFCNIQNQILDISNFQFVMNITNQHNRKVRYFLQCDTKILICQQSSNKIIPSQTNHGYSFIVEQHQHICLTFSLRNYPINSFAVNTKCAIDLMNVIMWNNFIWDPITIFKIRLKRKDDIVHHVNIQCQIKASQQWVCKFQAKMSAEYRIFFQLQEGSDAIRLLSNQPGFLKKGQNTTLRVLYSPENMKKCQATLRIANNMVKQVFKIQGKPMHSSKIQYQKTLKIIQNQDYQQQIILPWQLPVVTLAKKSSSAAKINASISSRQQNHTNISKNPQNQQQQYFTIKLINPNSQSSQSLNKFQQCILKKILTYNVIKKQLCLTFNFYYKRLIRNLQLIFQISHPQTNESKLIRLIIDIIPKPINIVADIQCQFNSSITQTIKIQNLAYMAENVSIKYGYIPSINKQNIDRQIKRLLADTYSTDSIVLANTYKGLFQLPKINNNQMLSFSSQKSQKFLQYINININYNPNQNNCIYSQHKRIQQTNNSNSPRSNKMKKNNSALKKKNQLNTSNNNSTNSNIDISQLKNNKNQLPYFYLILNYQQSLYQITYIFKPSIKKNQNKIQCLVTQQEKDIYHQCLPLVKYIDNIICIQNNNDYAVQYTIQTDLDQISGNNQLNVNAMSVDLWYALGEEIGQDTVQIDWQQQKSCQLGYIVQCHYFYNQNPQLNSLTASCNSEIPSKKSLPTIIRHPVIQ